MFTHGVVAWNAAFYIGRITRRDRPRQGLCSSLGLGSSHYLAVVRGWRSAFSQHRFLVFDCNVAIFYRCTHYRFIYQHYSWSACDLNISQNRFPGLSGYLASSWLGFLRLRQSHQLGCEGVNFSSLSERVHFCICLGYALPRWQYGIAELNEYWDSG